MDDEAQEVHNSLLIESVFIVGVLAVYTDMYVGNIRWQAQRVRTIMLLTASCNCLRMLCGLLTSLSLPDDCLATSSRYQYSNYPSSAVTFATTMVISSILPPLYRIPFLTASVSNGLFLSCFPAHILA